MAFPDDQVLWLLNNKPKVLRYIHGLQVVVGLVLMVLGLHMGHAHKEQFPRGTVRLFDRPATRLRLCLCPCAIPESTRCDTVED
jgi:hypothetical protein